MLFLVDKQGKMSYYISIVRNKRTERVNTMENQINKLLENIKEDYINWSTKNGTEAISSYSQGVLDDFDNNVQVKHGKKYIKIVGGISSGVWGFIVATDNHPKFKKGDILKAAGYNAPATNAARGNVFEDYTIRWTGPLYLS